MSNAYQIPIMNNWAVEQMKMSQHSILKTNAKNTSLKQYFHFFDNLWTKFFQIVRIKIVLRNIFLVIKWNAATVCSHLGITYVYKCITLMLLSTFTRNGKAVCVWGIIIIAFPLHLTRNITFGSLFVFHF